MYDNNVIKLRELKFKTQKELAAELDVNISTLNRIENGQIKQFKAKMLIKLSHLLSCKIDDLFVESNNEIKETLTFSKEQLYQKLLMSKDKRIKFLEESLKKK